MRIKMIADQHRRDFTAIYVCEHCGAEKTGCGYDDANFHDNVIPNMKCEQCGEKAPADFVPVVPKYAPHEIV